MPADLSKVSDIPNRFLAVSPYSFLISLFRKFLTNYNYLLFLSLIAYIFFGIQIAVICMWKTRFGPIVS